MAFKKGHKPWNTGKTHSSETRRKISQVLRGKSSWNSGIGKWSICIDCGKISGRINKRDHAKRCKKCYLASWRVNKENHPRWKTDRNSVKIGERKLHDPLQKQWAMSVKNRDGWKCKISNDNCFGRLEAHHILSWKDYPELRYEINNGITLCQRHHPKIREDVVKLSPYFQSLVAPLD